MSLENLFQCVTGLTVKNFFLKFNLNLPSFSLKTFPLVLLLHDLVEHPSLASLGTPFRYWKAAIGSSPHWTTTDLSACLQRQGGPALWPPLWLTCTLQQLHDHLMLKALELDAGEVSQEQSRREEPPSLNLQATLILIQSFWIGVGFLNCSYTV